MSNFKDMYNQQEYVFKEFPNFLLVGSASIDVNTDRNLYILNTCSIHHTISNVQVLKDKCLEYINLEHGNDSNANIITLRHIIPNIINFGDYTVSFVGRESFIASLIKYKDEYYIHTKNFVTRDISVVEDTFKIREEITGKLFISTLINEITEKFTDIASNYYELLELIIYGGYTYYLYKKMTSVATSISNLFQEFGIANEKSILDTLKTVNPNILRNIKYYMKNRDILANENISINNIILRILEGDNEYNVLMSIYNKVKQSFKIPYIERDELLEFFKNFTINKSIRTLMYITPQVLKGNLLDNITSMISAVYTGNLTLKNRSIIANIVSFDDTTGHIKLNLSELAKDYDIKEDMDIIDLAGRYGNVLVYEKNGFHYDTLKDVIDIMLSINIPRNNERLTSSLEDEQVQVEVEVEEVEDENLFTKYSELYKVNKIKLYDLKIQRNKLVKQYKIDIINIYNLLHKRVHGKIQIETKKLDSINDYINILDSIITEFNSSDSAITHFLEYSITDILLLDINFITMSNLFNKIQQVKFNYINSEIELNKQYLIHSENEMRSDFPATVEGYLGELSNMILDKVSEREIVSAEDIIELLNEYMEELESSDNEYGIVIQFQLGELAGKQVIGKDRELLMLLQKYYDTITNIRHNEMLKVYIESSNNVDKLSLVNNTNLYNEILKYEKLVILYRNIMISLKEKTGNVVSIRKTRMVITPRSFYKTKYRKAFNTLYTNKNIKDMRRLLNIDKLKADKDFMLKVDYTFIDKLSEEEVKGDAHIDILMKLDVNDMFTITQEDYANLKLPARYKENLDILLGRVK